VDRWTGGPVDRWTRLIYRGSDPTGFKKIFKKVKKVIAIMFFCVILILSGSDTGQNDERD
jgi:hypothetical protein